MKKGDINNYTNSFVPSELMANENDPYQIRNRFTDSSKYRDLKAEEIEILVKNGNSAQNWNKILVDNNFNPNLIKGCEFLGLVRIGMLNDIYLEYHDLRLPVGIYNSVVESCDIGDNVVMRNINYIAHYIISQECMLFNINEMITTNHAKFGVGILKEQEPEDIRVWVELGNENGNRAVLPFIGILTADAYLWSKFRGDKKLMSRLIELTEKTGDNKRGYYGQVGKNCVIKNTQIIKDANIGDYTYIKGANKLKNITILSNEHESSQIGEGVELVNGIVGFGSRIFYGCKAVRFITGRYTQVKYGARLLNSFLGDNSTISCCEILNNLIFPFHEQHHNNSFLIATTIMGQSNIAAGATIGSNHNSRSPDGEIVANRGFWPGLCTNLKHNSKFASFVLVAKGSYENELNISIPFSLVLKNIRENRIEIMVGFWFLYNMYAIARNCWKFKNRDKRFIKEQNIEYDVFAPDTINEMFAAIEMLLIAIGQNLADKNSASSSSLSESDYMELAEKFIKENGVDGDKKIELYLSGFENSSQLTKILKPVKGILIFKDMTLYHSMNVIKDYLLSLIENSKPDDIKDNIYFLLKPYYREMEKKWWNLGGQIIYDDDLKELIRGIKSKELDSWQDVHHKYDEFWEKYKKQKLSHALYSLEKLENTKLNDMNKEKWISFFHKAFEIQKKITKLTKYSKQKDYLNPYRKMVYDNNEEMEAVVGKISDNYFINHLDHETDKYEKDIDKILTFYFS